MTDNKSLVIRLLSTAVYSHPDLAKNDICNALNCYRGLTATLDKCTLPTGVKRELLCLKGTLPASYRNQVYNIPVNLWIVNNYPESPPLCWVNPTPDMCINVSRNVDDTGRIFLPYLTDWTQETSDLLGVIQVLIIAFGEQPPLFKKPMTPNPSFSPLFEPNNILGNASASLKPSTPKVNLEISVKEISQKGPSSLSTTYQTLLEKALFSDVILQVSGKEFKVHKAILAVRSPVFQAMFENDLKESREGVVDIEDVEVKTFEAFLRYLYTDQVENLGEIAAELIALADRYQVDSLKSLCGEHLSLEITNDSFSRLFLLSHMHQVDTLKAECLKYFEAHVKEIVARSDWDTFMSQNLELLPILLKSMALKS